MSIFEKDNSLDSSTLSDISDSESDNNSSEENEEKIINNTLSKNDNEKKAKNQFIEDIDIAPKDIVNQIKFLKENQKGIHFQLISKISIAIEFVPKEDFSPIAENIIQNNEGYFDNNLEIIFAPYKNYEKILEQLSNIEPYKSDPTKLIHKIPQFVIDVYNNISYDELMFETFDKQKDFKIKYEDDKKYPRNVTFIPKELKQKLFDFQIKGIDFGAVHHCRFLLADEMGVGKTVQAIALAKIYEKNWPVLIICPGSLKYQWRHEIKKWLQWKNNNKIEIINNSNQKISHKKCFYITSYDLMRNIYDKIIDKDFNFLILDESHLIKNINSKRAKAIIPIAQRAKRLILLSGTPLLNKPVEGYTSLLCLRPDLFKNFYDYGKRYCDPVLTPFGINWSGASNTKELHFLLDSLMIRRLKSKVLTLPKKDRKRVNIRVNKKIVKEIMDETQKKSGLELYSLTCKAKIKGVLEYIKDIIDIGKEKFIVFAYHKLMLDKIENKLDKLNVKYIRIDGETPQEDRPELVESFQTKKDIQVALLSIKVGSNGLNLTAANLVIFAELDFTPSMLKQGEDRIHRIGQLNKNVEIRYLFGRHTYDEQMYKIIDKKNIVVGTTLDDQKEKEFIHKKENYKTMKKHNQGTKMLNKKNKDDLIDSNNSNTNLNTISITNEDLNLDKSSENQNINSRKKRFIEDEDVFFLFNQNEDSLGNEKNNNDKIIFYNIGANVNERK